MKGIIHVPTHNGGLIRKIDGIDARDRLIDLLDTGVVRCLDLILIALVIDMDLRVWAITNRSVGNHKLRRVDFRPHREDSQTANEALALDP